MNPDETMRMLQAAAVLFTVAALGGLVMAGIRFRGRRNPPAWLAMLHGLLAGAGVTLLAYAWYAGGIPALALLALLLFLLAAAGGVRSPVSETFVRLSRGALVRIAAIARVHGAAIATRDGDLAGCGVPLIDPWQA